MASNIFSQALRFNPEKRTGAKGQGVCGQGFDPVRRDFPGKVKNNKDAAISFVEARNLNPTQPQWVQRINAGIESITDIEIANGGVFQRQSDDLDLSSYESQIANPDRPLDDRQLASY